MRVAQAAQVVRFRLVPRAEEGTMNKPPRNKRRRIAMFRRVFLSAALGVATLAGLTMTPGTAEARTYHTHRVHRLHRFEVLYCECGRWTCYGTYGERCEADRVAHSLRCRGFDVRIHRC